MSEKTLINYNPLTSVETYLHEHEDGSKGIETVQGNIGSLIDYCKAAREATQHERFGEGRVAAKIPAAMAGQLMREGKLFDQEYMRKWLKEHPVFRTFDKTF